MCITGTYITCPTLSIQTVILVGRGILLRVVPTNEGKTIPKKILIGLLNVLDLPYERRRVKRNVNGKDFSQISV